MGTVRFLIRDLRKKDDPITKKAGIDLIYSLHGQRKFYRITDKEVKLYPCNWDQKDQEAITIDKETAKKVAPLIKFDLLLTFKEKQKVNDILSSYRVRIADIENKFEANGIIYSSEMVIAALNDEKKVTTKKEVKENNIIRFIDDFIKTNPKNLTEGTLNVYNQLISHLENMGRDKNMVLNFEKTNMKFMETFQSYLINEKGLENSTIARQMTALTTIFIDATKKEEKVNQGFLHFKKIKVAEKSVISLTEDELQKLISLKLPLNSSHDLVRNVFLFSCETALRDRDLANLKWEHIFLKAQTPHIRYMAKKTKKELYIPLSPIAQSILKKNLGKSKPLNRVYNNANCNKYLQGWENSWKKKRGVIEKHVGVCELAGIDTPTIYYEDKGAIRIENVYPKYELIAMHTARKTFITLSLRRGMPIAEIMKISGHKTYSSFKRYLEINEEQLNNAMIRATANIPKTIEMKIAK